MDKERLCELVNAARNNPPHFGSTSDHPLVRELEGEAELAMFKDAMHYYVYGYGRMTHVELGGWLVRRAAVVGAAQAVADLERYTSSAAIPYRLVMATAGVTIDEPIELDGRMTVYPFAMVAQTSWAQNVAAKYSEFHPNYQPSAALIQQRDFPRRIIKIGDFAEFEDGLFTELDDVRLCITSIGPSAPVFLGSWVDPPEWMPTSGSAANIRNPFQLEGLPPEPSKAVTKAELVPLHRCWLALSEKEKRHLRVPLQRLNTAMRREVAVDKAIDLGIAIDALFLAEREADRGELTLLLRLRASRFLGHDAASRKELARFFALLYRARSSAVHSGTVSEQIDGIPMPSLLERGFGLTAAAIRIIIDAGEPDWHSLVFS